MADIERARQLRKDETWAEKLLWRWLRDRRFSHYKFRRQHPEGIYYLDFFCEAARLSIELDGFGHGHPDQQRHDVERKAFLTSRGIKARHQGTAVLEFQFAAQRADYSGYNLSRVT